jgi:hypothetical protein
MMRVFIGVHTHTRIRVFFGYFLYPT